MKFSSYFFLLTKVNKTLWLCWKHCSIPKHCTQKRFLPKSQEFLVSASPLCAYTMSKKNLCAPLSSLLRRSSTSSPKHCTSRFSPHIKLSFLHYASPHHPPPHAPTFHFNSSLGFSWKSLCSKSAVEIQRGCWNCHALPHSAPFLVCDSCRCIQPVDGSTDYFEIFGV